MEAWHIYTAIIALACVAIYAAGWWYSMRRTAYLMRGSIIQLRNGRHVIVRRVSTYCAHVIRIDGTRSAIPLRGIAHDSAGRWVAFAWWEVK